MAQEIVIGWSLEAALLAYQKHCPLVVCFENEYLIRHYFNPKTNFDYFGMQNSSKTLKTNHGSLKIGLFKRDVLTMIQYQLSLMGLLYKGTFSIDGNTAVFRTESNFTKTFVCDSFIVVNPEGIQFKNIELIERTFEICDHYKTLFLDMKYDLLLSGYHKYCQEIWLYESDELKHLNHKDMGVISILNDLEIDDPNYSEHIMKLRANDVLETIGIEEEEHSTYRLREMFINNKYIAEDYDNVKFCLNIGLEDILKRPAHIKTRNFVQLYKGDLRA